MLPKFGQRLIWATYKAGQEVRKDPTRAYLIAQSYAVAKVAEREGRWSSAQAAEHVMDAAEAHAHALSDMERALLRDILP